MDLLRDPFISIIMNCYNSDRFLHEAITSVMQQTYNNWEIIFWDNQSTDSSRNIVKSFQDERIQYFYAPTHTTLGMARNLAVEKAKGVWIAFLDCDDIWLPHKLQSQASLIKTANKNLGLVYTRAKILGGKYHNREYAPEYIGRLLPEGNIIKEYLLSDNFIPLLSAVIKRDLYHEVGGIPEFYKQSEDFYIFAAIALKHQVLVVQDICCLYRQHSGNLSLLQKELACSENISILEKFWPMTNEPNIGIEKKQNKIKTITALLGIYLVSSKKNIPVGLYKIFSNPIFSIQLVFTHFTARLLTIISRIFA